MCSRSHMLPPGTMFNVCHGAQATAPPGAGNESQMRVLVERFPKHFPITTLHACSAKSLWQGYCRKNKE